MSDTNDDSGHVRLDYDLPILLDQLGSVVATDTAPVAPVYASVSSSVGDEALVLLVADTGRAIEALAGQVTILRNEMRVTMLNAIAADTYTEIDNVILPEPGE